MPLMLAGTIALAFLGPAATPPVARCMNESDHKPGHVYRHPITPMHTAKPRNPLEDPLPICRARDGERAPG